MIRKALELNFESQSLHTQAQQLLEQKLGLDKLVFEKPVGYEVNFSTVEQTRIIDSKYHNPKYKILKEQLRTKYTTFKLKQIANVEYGYMPTQDYEANPSKGIPLIRVTNIQEDLEIKTNI